MGTDIHAVFQRRRNGHWEDIASDWDQNRDYYLFAWLANVRNSYGSCRRAHAYAAQADLKPARLSG
jgi:hypothetical protein